LTLAKRRTAEELRAEAEAYLEWRSGGHTDKTASTERHKIRRVLDRLEARETSEQVANSASAADPRPWLARLQDGRG